MLSLLILIMVMERGLVMVDERKKGCLFRLVTNAADTVVRERSRPAAVINLANYRQRKEMAEYFSWTVRVIIGHEEDDYDEEGLVNLDELYALKKAVELSHYYDDSVFWVDKKQKLVVVDAVEWYERNE